MGPIYSKIKIIIGLILIIVPLVIFNFPIDMPQSPGATLKELTSQSLMVPLSLRIILGLGSAFLGLVMLVGMFLISLAIARNLSERNKKKVNFIVWMSALVCMFTVGFNWYLVIKPLPESKKDDMATIAKAKEDINKYRQGDVILNIVDSQGQPRSGVAVDYIQIKHSFFFSFYNKELEKADTLIIPMKEAGFNSALHMMNWQVQEPEPGVYDFDGWEGVGDPRLRDCRLEVQDFYQADLTGIGYSIYITSSVPEFVLAPSYVYSLSFEELKKAVYQYVYRTVKYYQNGIKIWNIFNEPMMMAENALNLNKEQEIEIIREGIRAISEAGFEGETMIVIWPPGGELSYMYPYDFLQDTIAAGVDFDIIGLEWYYNSYGAPYWGGGPFLRRSLFSISEVIDKYSTLGKKIFIDEISIPSEKIGQGYWGQDWSEDLQAEYLAAAYTIFFSQPQVIGIGYWDVVDKDAFIYHGGLLDEQNQPKKAYDTLKNLIASWTTTGTGITDENGQIRFRGFAGTYGMVFSDPATSLSLEKEIIIEEQENNIFTFAF